jgi:hypothetical protein
VGGTATAVNSSVTINQSIGEATTASLTTAAGSTYSFSINNTEAAAGDIVMATLSPGTNSAGIPIFERVGATSERIDFRILNIHDTDAFNGTIKIQFLLIKVS